MKLLQIRLGFVILIFMLTTASVLAYSPDPPNYVHQYITNQSRNVWPLIPYEIKTHLNASLDNSLGSGTYDTGEDIISGSGEEDRPFFNVRFHLWDPDVPNFVDVGDYNNGVYGFKSNYQNALGIWKTKVIPLYLKGEINESYYWLGRVTHLLEDLTVPAHSHNDDHNSIVFKSNADTFEEYAKKVFTNYSGKDYSGNFYRYEDLPNMTAANWSEVDAKDKNQIELFRLFWFTSQRAQYFASDDKQRNDYYVNLSGVQKTFNPSLWSGENVNLTANTSDQITTHLNDISNAEIPHAMRAVAGLYRLFWDAVQIDWPTYHHDYRRTGFTLLKGDVNKASDIDASNVALKDTISSYILIRPSVSDLDGNGHQDVVTVMYQLDGSGNTDVYAVERRDKILNWWWMRTEPRWHAILPVSYPLLPVDFIDYKILMGDGM